MAVTEVQNGQSVARLHIGIGQLRSRAGDYIRDAGAGIEIIVLRRGKPTASRISEVASANGGRRNVVTADLNRLRTSAGRLLDEVADGAVVEIVHRGEAVALITRWNRSPLKEPRVGGLSSCRCNQRRSAATARSGRGTIPGLPD